MVLVFIVWDLMVNYLLACCNESGVVTSKSNEGVHLVFEVKLDSKHIFVDDFVANQVANEVWIGAS